MVLTEFLIHFSNSFWWKERLMEVALGIWSWWAFVVSRGWKITFNSINILSMHLICFKWCGCYIMTTATALSDFTENNFTAPRDNHIFGQDKKSTPRYHDLAIAASQTLSHTYNTNHQKLLNNTPGTKAGRS